MYILYIVSTGVLLSFLVDLQPLELQECIVTPYVLSPQSNVKVSVGGELKNWIDVFQRMQLNSRLKMNI